MESAIKVLIVEDVRTDAELIARQLKRTGIDHSVERVETRGDFLRSLKVFAPDVILSDYSMPHFDGLTALELARVNTPCTPFIFVSGKMGEEIAIDSLKRGAADYILKSNLARLGPAVVRALKDKADLAAKRQVEAELQEAQELFKLFMRHLPGPAFIKDLAGAYRYVNSVWEKITGEKSADVIGRADTNLWPELATQYAINDRATLEGKCAVQRLETFPQADGMHTFLVTKFPITDAAGQPILLGGVAVDFTEQLHAEEKVARLTRIYQVLSGINSAIVRIRDREVLFREACRIATEHGGFRLAWIGLLDKATQDVKPVAWVGHDEGFMEIISRSAREDVSAGRGIVGNVMRGGSPVVVNDITSDPRIRRVNEAIKHGFLSALGLPLRVDGETIGSISLFAGQAGVFDHEEVKLLAGMAGDISFALEHIGKQEKLDHLAYYDPLTALPNRTLFCDRVDFFTRSSAEKRMVVMLLDMERFATINETLGRQAGDALLKLVAERLLGALGEGAGLARIGGDHFAIQLLEFSEPADIVQVVEDKIFIALSRPFRLKDEELRLSFKCGIALYPADGVDAEALLVNAEAALKKAKDSGDKYMFYAPQMNARIAEILSLENQLRIAIVEQQFVLHYQPKVNLATNRITGLEALIRWMSPELGLVPPYKFIPILEETGMILEVGMWVLRQAVEDQRRWRANGLNPPRIAVNISSLQLRQKGFVDDVMTVITEDEDNPAAIDLEITESVIMLNIEQYIPELKKLRAMGVGIDIDDFGTGYSSLSYIARLPVSALKIDRSFINEMANSDDGIAIVSTIISLAHALNLTVVAEGVETNAQRELLKMLKCDTLQGYLFGKPLPAAEIEAFFGA